MHTEAFQFQMQTKRKMRKCFITKYGQVITIKIDDRAGVTLLKLAITLRMPLYWSWQQSNDFVRMWMHKLYMVLWSEIDSKKGDAFLMKHLQKIIGGNRFAVEFCIFFFHFDWHEITMTKNS